MAAFAKQRLLRYKFRRQQPVGPYIIDFVSYETKLIVELDGGQHNAANVMTYDTARSAYLQELGYTVLRFWNNDVIENLDGVCAKIQSAIPSPQPSPPGEGVMNSAKYGSSSFSFR